MYELYKILTLIFCE